jgi:hypothetical protein
LRRIGERCETRRSRIRFGPRPANPREIAASARICPIHAGRDWLIEGIVQTDSNDRRPAGDGVTLFEAHRVVA